MKPYYESKDGGVVLYHGDCRDVLAGLEASTFHAAVTDPPYEIGFMGRAWDSSGVAFKPETWAACERVLKPGGHLLAFGATRTVHRIACAIEDAGYEIRDMISWLYGSGFAKSLDVGKAIDKSRAGVAFDAIRERIRDAIRAACMSHVEVKRRLGYPEDSGIVSHWVANSQPSVPGWRDWERMKLFLPLGDDYDGLIRSAERDVVGRKWAGIANPSDADRHTIGGSSAVLVDVTIASTDAAKQWDGWGTALRPACEPLVLARKPMRGTVAQNVLTHGTGAINIAGAWLEREDSDAGWPSNVILDDDTARAMGEPSRYFYVAKPSQAERGEANNHPTLKPLTLMRYLCRMVTPPGGLLVDPFAGSGTTLIAARKEGFRAVGVELEEAHCEIIAKRLELGAAADPDDPKASGPRQSMLPL